MLHPGEFVLGSTLERVALPDDLVARLEGKSSLGRLGLLIHSTAGFVDAGWDGHLTLELSNVANLPITLYPGMKIGQITFMRMTTPADDPYGSAEVGSKYQGQRGPTPEPLLGELQLRLSTPLPATRLLSELHAVASGGHVGQERGPRALRSDHSASTVRSQLIDSCEGRAARATASRPTPRSSPHTLEQVRAEQPPAPLERVDLADAVAGACARRRPARRCPAARGARSPGTPLQRGRVHAVEQGPRHDPLVAVHERDPDERVVVGGRQQREPAELTAMSSGRRRGPTARRASGRARPRGRRRPRGRSTSW